MKEKKQFLKNKFIKFQRNIDSLKHEKSDIIDDYQQQLVGMNLKFIALLDFFENIEENFKNKEDTFDVDSRHLLKDIRTAEKKIRRILNSNKIDIISFPENIAIMELSKIVNTLPDDSKKDGSIIEILKNGYFDKKNDKVIRKAELITVRNN